MIRLYFDTETTGFYDFKSAPSASHQPHVVQLAWALENGDNTLWRNYIIRPDRWQIPPDSIAIHGITQERAEAKGVMLGTILDAFRTEYNTADEIIAHNLNFDMAIMNSQYARNERFILPQKKRYCTMEATTNICKLPGKWGGYKWPKLEEAYRFLVDPKGFEGAHDALNDVRACRALFHKLVEEGHYKEAES